MRARGETNRLSCVNCGASVLKQQGTLTVVAEGGKASATASTAAAATTAAAPRSSSVANGASSPRTSTGTGASARQVAFQPVASSAVAGGDNRSARTVRARGRNTRRQRIEEGEDAEEDEEEDEMERLRREDESEAAAEEAQRRTDAAIEEQEDDPYSLRDVPEDLSDAAVAAAAARKRNDRRNGESLPQPHSQSKTDSVSANLGQKMLQGYTLLAQHCPKEDCGVSAITVAMKA